MSRSFVLCGLVVGAALGACVSIPDPNHCWRRDGDRTCRELFGAGAVCSPCLRHYNGCVDADEEPDCGGEESSSSEG
jgi:hypothetical protein